MMLDIPQSTKAILERLLDLGYSVLIYSTQLDVIVPHVGLRKLVNTLRWAGAEDFGKARQELWKVDDDVAGYIKSFENLSYLFMRNAGHSAPYDQPHWSFRMITDFTRGRL